MGEAHLLGVGLLHRFLGLAKLKIGRCYTGRATRPPNQFLGAKGRQLRVGIECGEKLEFGTWFLSIIEVVLIKIRIALTVLLAFGGCWLVMGNDQPALYRGSQSLAGYTADAQIDFPLKEMWRFGAGSAILAPPAVWNGQVFLVSSDGYLYKLGLEDGVVNWRYHASGRVKSAPCVGGGLVYFGDEFGQMHALDAETGVVKWRFQARDAIFGAPNLSGNQLVFTSYDQHVYCLDAENGALNWQFETQGFIDGVPAIGEDRLYVAGSDGILRSLALENGELQWESQIGSVVQGSPVISQGLVIVGSFAAEVKAFGLESGANVWRYTSLAKDMIVTGPAAVAEDLVIVAGWDGNLHALQPDSGRLLWRHRLRTKLEAAPTVVGHSVLMGDLTGLLVILDRNSGKRRWSKKMGSAIRTDVVYHRHRVMVALESGDLICMAF